MGAGRGLGKGLGALLGGSYGDAEGVQGNIIMLHVNAIQPNALQPRKDFPQESLEELSRSIRSQGVLQPVLVRISSKGDRYELVAGERRWRASLMAGLQEIPAVIREVSDKESLELALIENIQREDLNAIEQAKALQQLQSQFQATQQELAERTGVSRSHVANLMRLLQLPEGCQEDVRTQRYSPGHGRALAGITDPESQELLRQKILEDELSVRACEELCAHWKKHGVFPFQKGADRTKTSSSHDDALAEYARQVNICLGAKKVRFRGTRERGSMTVSYASRSEFEKIMAKLGIGGEVLDDQAG